MSKAKTPIDIKIEQGAKWLDEMIPGWAARINIKKLDLLDNVDCILGQLCGHVTVAFYPQIPLGRRIATFDGYGFWWEGKSATVVAQAKSAWRREIESRTEQQKEFEF